MATTIKAEYYRFNGTDWDTFYFKTSADLLVETASYKVMTAAERTAIDAYLKTFNAANQLVKLDGNNKIPVTHIPSLPYLPLSGGTLTNNLVIYGPGMGLTADQVVASRVYTQKITSDSDILTIGALEIMFDESGQISNLDTPTLGHQAATKEYVDNLVSVGFKVKAPVMAASVGDVTITSALYTLDGYTLMAGERVLLKDQATASQNGIYQLNASNIPVKVVDDSKIGAAVFVENGETNNDYIYTQSMPDSWVVFTKPDTLKVGEGLTKIGTTISIPFQGVTDTMIKGISSGKIATFSSSDEEDWTDIQSTGVNKSLAGHLGDLYSAIRHLRGTTNYNTDNSQTIAGAYTRVAGVELGKNKTEAGSTLPSGPYTGYVTGDLFFKTLA